MTTYRHVTNLRVPLNGPDLGLLGLLTDYRLGAPVVAVVPTTYPLEELRARGFVGLYLLPTELETNGDLRDRTGWGPGALGETGWVP